MLIVNHSRVLITQWINKWSGVTVSYFIFLKGDVKGTLN